MRLCILARSDETGLGIQSRNWVRLLDPHKTIIINSNPFNGNAQHFEWYNKRNNAYIVDGFIGNGQIEPILNNIDVLLTFEIPYNYDLIRIAKNKGIKTIIQNNWEFTDYLKQPHLPLPDLLVNHSYWHLDEQKTLWPLISEYCATPLFLEDYDSIYLQNLSRNSKMRFLHIAGRKTYEDRNGTQDLIDSVKLMPEGLDFELVIKTQNVEIVQPEDPRIIIDRNSPVDEKELYRDFDAMIMPRRYGGACLPMNEALASGLPVIMTNIDPNNKVLPNNWLVPSGKQGSFMARTNIEVYSASHNALAARIAEFTVLDRDTLNRYKELARDIAKKEYSSESVKHKWDLLMQKLGV